MDELSLPQIPEHFCSINISYLIGVLEKAAALYAFEPVFAIHQPHEGYICAQPASEASLS